MAKAEALAHAAKEQIKGTVEETRDRLLEKLQPRLHGMHVKEDLTHECAMKSEAILQEAKHLQEAGDEVRYRHNLV